VEEERVTGLFVDPVATHTGIHNRIGFPKSFA